MTTNPILDTELIEDISEYLKNRSDKGYVLFKLGIYTGIRIQDMLKLRVRDIKNDNGKIKETISIQEGKTTKPREIDMHSKLKRILEEYTRGKPGYEYLFKSREGSNKAISRQQAWNILTEAGKVFNIRVSPHTLRKTFARRLYEISDGDITVPMEALNHTTPKQTRTYIKITAAVVNKYVNRLDY